MERDTSDLKLTLHSASAAFARQENSSSNPGYHNSAKVPSGAQFCFPLPVPLYNLSIHGLGSDSPSPEVRGGQCKHGDCISVIHRTVTLSHDLQHPYFTRIGYHKHGTRASILGILWKVTSLDVRLVIRKSASDRLTLPHNSRFGSRFFS